MFRFFTALFSFTGLLILIGWGGSSFLNWALPGFWLEIILFSFSITAIITYKLFNIRKAQPQAFVQFYLLSITLKMIAGLGFAVFLIWKIPTGIRGNVGFFLFTYILFTLLEVFALMRKNNGKERI